MPYSKVIPHMKRGSVRLECHECGAVYFRSPSMSIGSRYCSKKCRGRGKKGKDHPRWKGGIRKGIKYNRIYAKGHPHAYKNYIYEHKYVMEKHIGRLLFKNEYIHHINKIYIIF